MSRTLPPHTSHLSSVAHGQRYTLRTLELIHGTFKFGSGEAQRAANGVERVPIHVIVTPVERDGLTPIACPPLVIALASALDVAVTQLAQIRLKFAHLGRSDADEELVVT